MTKSVLTVKDVAEYLGISSMTVYRYAKAGIIPAFKIGSDWRFYKNSLDGWIKSKEQWHAKKIEQRKNE